MAGRSGSSYLRRMEVSTLRMGKVLTGSLIRPKRFEQDMTWLRVGIASRYVTARSQRC
jgi:hypothetical protein